MSLFSFPSTRINCCAGHQAGHRGHSGDLHVALPLRRQSLRWALRPDLPGFPFRHEPWMSRVSPCRPSAAPPDPQWSLAYSFLKGEGVVLDAIRTISLSLGPHPTHFSPGPLQSLQLFSRWSHLPKPNSPNFIPMAGSVHSPTPTLLKQLYGFSELWYRPQHQLVCSLPIPASSPFVLRSYPSSWSVEMNMCWIF